MRERGIRTTVDLDIALARAAVARAREKQLGLAGLCKLAVVAYARRRGFNLIRAGVTSRHKPRFSRVVEVEMPRAWQPVIETLAADGSVAGLVREALREHVGRAA